jgi:hypothetical protein
MKSKIVAGLLGLALAFGFVGFVAQGPLPTADDAGMFYVPPYKCVKLKPVGQFQSLNDPIAYFNRTKVKQTVWITENSRVEGYITSC